jgi:cell wall-associated NlpC family hydrolase
MSIRQRIAIFMLSSAMVCGGAVAIGTGTAGAAQLPSVSVAATDDSVAVTAAGALAAIGTSTFAVRLEDASYAVASSLQVDAGRLQQAWLAADQPHQVALLSALTQVGVPYHRNTSKVGIAFDCSGLTAFAWAQSGVELARHSTTQLRNSAARTVDTAQAGDLVYYPGHVMLWLGMDNLIVHAPTRGRNVEVDEITKRHVSRVKFGNPIG